MPCDSLRETTLNFGNISPEILTAALNRMELNAALGNNAIYFSGGGYNITSGQLRLEGSNAQERAAEIKRGYSAEVIRSQARKNGWTVKETGKNQLRVIKGY